MTCLAQFRHHAELCLWLSYSLWYGVQADKVMVCEWAGSQIQNPRSEVCLWTMVSECIAEHTSLPASSMFRTCLPSANMWGAKVAIPARHTPWTPTLLPLEAAHSVSVRQRCTKTRALFAYNYTCEQKIRCHVDRGPSTRCHPSLMCSLCVWTPLKIADQHVRLPFASVLGCSWGVSLWSVCIFPHTPYTTLCQREGSALTFPWQTSFVCKDPFLEGWRRSTALL